MLKCLFFIVGLFIFLGDCSVSKLSSNTKEVTPNNSHLDLVKTHNNIEQSTVEDKLPVKNVNLIEKGLQDWDLKKQKIENDNLTTIFFSDAAHGWVASLKGNILIPEGGNLYRTTNGGQTWKKLGLELPSNSFISKIFFLNNSKGWLVIQTERDSDENTNAQIKILQTNDSGETWKSQFSLKNAFASKLILSETGEGWLIGLRGTATYHRDAVWFALHTTNFGKLWEDVSPKSLITNKEYLTTKITSPRFLTDVYFLGNLQAIMISSDGQIIKTSDGGINWQLITKIKNEFYSKGFFHFQVKGASEFLALSGANSREGTWTTISLFNEEKLIDKFSLSEIYFNDLLWLPNGEIIACGEKQYVSKNKITTNGVIMYSKDLQNWEIVYEETSMINKIGSTFNKITSDNNGKYYTVSNQGTIVSMSKK